VCIDCVRAGFAILEIGGEARLLCDGRPVPFSPDVHFAAEARHNGTKMYVFAPDFNHKRVDKTGGTLKLSDYVDPKGTVPRWIVNMFQKSFPRQTLKALRKQASRDDVGEHPAVKAAFLKAPGASQPAVVSR